MKRKGDDNYLLDLNVHKFFYFIVLYFLKWFFLYTHSTINYFYLFWGDYSFIAWRSSGSFSSPNFSGRGEEGLADISLGQHGGWEPVTVGVSSQFNSLRTSSESPTRWLQFVLLESSQIWTPFHFHCHRCWFDSHKMIFHFFFFAIYYFNNVFAFTLRIFKYKSYCCKL